MITTAIALFGSRISPRFDCAQDFMLITTSDSAVTARHTETIKESMSLNKVRRLAELKVDTLICGGIDESSRQHLDVYGIKVLANRKGTVDDVVSHCLPALPPTPPIPMPPISHLPAPPPGGGVQQAVTTKLLGHSG
jgi:predicted Fe-Mo cluster-binding NifX family protein